MHFILLVFKHWPPCKFFILAQANVSHLFFLCSLFNDAVSNLDYTASHDG